MPRTKRRAGLGILALLVAVAATACTSEGPREPVRDLRYVGSSTVAIFLREAEERHPGFRFEIDSEPESGGGEAAILERRTDLGGTARHPDVSLAQDGVRTTLIGRDAIAVVVHPDNPITEITRDELRGIFTGDVRNWRDLGGMDLPIRPMIVAQESATHHVFRAAMLAGEDYAGCEVIQPDRAIVDAVSSAPGAIGTISFAFLGPDAGVLTVSVEGQRPAVTNFEYPIARPLYLLWRPDREDVKRFVDWATSPAGQRVVMQHFVGIRVTGSVGARREREAPGYLVVHTETFRVYDGGIDYFPHRPYEIFDRYGRSLRRVRNHRGRNDETPERVELAPGTYLIRPESARPTEAPELFVTIEPGRVTEVHVTPSGAGPR